MPAVDAGGRKKRGERKGKERKEKTRKARKGWRRRRRRERKRRKNLWIVVMGCWYFASGCNGLKDVGGNQIVAGYWYTSSVECGC